MQRLWAPWRANYVTKIIPNQKGCIFCRILGSKKDKENFVFIRRPLATAVLNLYPYSNGHCMVLSNRHASDISRLTQKEYAGLMDLVRETKELLQETFKPQGFNVGINIGRLAGAGIPGHIHVHIVPRWKGDHNFMPVTASTKVISQSLSIVYKKLDDAYQKRHRATRR